jgi:hypothetical protein
MKTISKKKTNLWNVYVLQVIIFNFLLPVKEPKDFDKSLKILLVCGISRYIERA